MDHDPYVYPGTEVLINKLNIQDSAKLAQAEASLYIIKRIENLPQRDFDYNYLKALHKHLFGALYAWAGEERTVNIIKGASHFARKEFITPEIEKLFVKLKADHYLRNSDKEIFAKKAAYYFNEINAAHPFREGNGRTLRMFFNLLAEQAGYQFDWTKINKQEYINASILGFNADNKAMEDIFRKAILPLEQELSHESEKSKGAAEHTEKKILQNNFSKSHNIQAGFNQSDNIETLNESFSVFQQESLKNDVSIVDFGPLALKKKIIFGKKSCSRALN